MTLLYFGVIDWHFLRQRPQHLASELARTHDVLYTYPRAFIGTWIGRKALPHGALRHWVEDPENQGRRLHLYEPMLLPKHKGEVLRWVNRRLFARGLVRNLKASGLKPDWIWVGHPTQVVHLNSFPTTPVVYDCMDHWTQFPRADGVAEAERQLVSRARFVITTSRHLHERIKGMKPDTFLVPNGVDHAHFRRALELRTRRRSSANPKAVTMGTLGQWIDGALIESVARQCPDWEFLLVGPWDEDVRPSQRPKAANVTWLGRLPYVELPELLANADVAFLPFRVNELTRAVDPVKVYEFLAAGLPVVSTPLPEIRKFGSGVSIASSGDGFAQALEEVHTGAVDRRALSDSVLGHDWSIRAREVLALLEQFR
jgi:glycosyltransferase involved in cell wall biosynthesis